MAKGDMVFFLLPLLMLNLLAGTLAQARLGLYETHKTFFASFIYFLGPLPLPGTYTLLGLLTIGLFLKFIFFSEWKKSKAGIILVHLGALILLAGGLMTALTAREGFMVIAENESTPYIYDYNHRELFIFHGDALQHRIRFENLHGKITLKNFPFIFQVLDSCRNCAIGEREKDGNYKGMARFMKLQPKALEKENETNMPGITFNITGGDKDQDGTYIAFENMPKPIELTKNKETYKIMFGKEQRLLPFSLSLKKFERENYPGTQTARLYSSDITVEDGAWQQDFRIEMNNPLRYKGYTFYQSSFEETPERTATILAVVENKGRLLPYISSAIITLGLLLQIFIMTKRRRT